MMCNILYVESSTIEDKVLKSCRTIIAAFFPGKTMEINILGQGSVPSGKRDVLTSRLVVESCEECSHTFDLSYLEKDQVLCEQTIHSQGIIPLEQDCPLPGKEALFQILVKRAVYLFLATYTGEAIPWGTLTGIRPGKLILRMEELGLKKEMQNSILKELYMAAEDKVRLLQYVAGIQKSYLRHVQERPDLVSVYLTIPFCPSHCFYCSFPSKQLISKNSDLLHKYLEALYQEIELTGETLKELGLKAESIYIGGGTPTILQADELEELLGVIHKQLNLGEMAEFTLEGGRPDTIDYEKLTVMKKYRINRLSINPQSMHDRTLKSIGRNHQAADILKCYRLARELSDWAINMDLILGLPGESFAEMKESVDQVLALKPDNLTLHALALKKGSSAWENHYVPNSQKDWAGLQSSLQKTVLEAGFVPYYLYRQKYIVGNLENVGYTLPGKECRYNMAMIDEQQNIIGLGAGASSKILRRPDSGHVNIYNSMDIDYYLTRFRDVHEQRKQLLQEEYEYLAKKR